MNAVNAQDPTSGPHRTTVERRSERELIITRIFNASVRRVFAAWTTPELLQQWWAPKSVGISFISCAVDARTGGTYRFVFGHPAAPDPMAFFGRYLEVIPEVRLVWTNEEAGEAGSVTTVTFTEEEGRTLVVMQDLYPTKEALDGAIESGSTCGFDETFAQLDELFGASNQGG